MKVFLLEPDIELADRIDTSLNQLRLKINITKVQNEEDIFQEDFPLSEYALFVLNLKNPTDPSILKFLRTKGCDAPVLLILEPDFSPSSFKRLYYMAYDDFIIKKFSPQEITFRIYKLCHIWNDDIFFLCKDVYFDSKNSSFFHHEEEVSLGKKESLFLKYLLAKAPHIISFDEIASYVYLDEFVHPETIRSLVRQLRSKIPCNLIETVKGEGYKVPITTMGEGFKGTLAQLVLPWLPLIEVSESFL